MNKHHERFLIYVPVLCLPVPPIPAGNRSALCNGYLYTCSCCRLWTRRVGRYCTIPNTHCVRSELPGNRDIVYIHAWPELRKECCKRNIYYIRVHCAYNVFGKVLFNVVYRTGRFRYKCITYNLTPRRLRNPLSCWAALRGTRVVHIYAWGYLEQGKGVKSWQK